MHDRIWVVRSVLRHRRFAICLREHHLGTELLLIELNRLGTISLKSYVRFDPLHFVLLRSLTLFVFSPPQAIRASSQGASRGSRPFSPQLSTQRIPFCSCTESY